MIIGLVGNIGNGKGTVADILVEEHDFFKESFANSVKDACATIFGWSRELLEGDTPESRAWREQPDEWWSNSFGYSFSPRYALQLMGTEAGRNVFHSDLWVHTLMRRCSQAPWNDYVIADVRFPNEIKAIAESGGKIIRIRRGADPEWYALAFECNLNSTPEVMQREYPSVHYSEWAWIGASHDVTLDNNCTLDELRVRVANVLDSLHNNRVEANEVL
jgi:hypothetical protein